MILKAYLPRLLSPLIFGGCAVVGLLTFGQPLAFDLIQTVTLLFVSVACRKHINLLSICIILLVSQCAMNGYYLVYDNTWYWKVFTYSCTAILLYYFHGDRANNTALVFFVLTLITECYWVTVGYSAPQLFFIFWKINIYILCRFAFVYRPHYLRIRRKLNANVTPLDNHLYKLHTWVLYLQCLMILEYLIRHLTAFKPLYVYSAYEYIMQAMGVFVFYMITITFVRIWQKTRLTA
jgi:hypothetical protein